MGDNNQLNVRLSDKTGAEFRNFCKEYGLTQAQGVDHLMQVFEINKAKDVVPERKTEIEAFEKAVKDIMDFYLMSVELGKNAEERAKENFRSMLKSKDKIIADLQGKVEVYKADKEEAEQMALASSSSLAQAVKEADAAKEQAAMSKKLLEEKEKTVSTLAEKANAYDGLLETNTELKEEVKELKHTLERKDSDAKKDMDLAVAKAVAEKEKEMMQKIMELEKENATLSVKLELLQSK